MYYQHTKLHTRNSNLSVATSDDLVNWGNSTILDIPKNSSWNRIDPNLLILNTTQTNGSAELYFSFGSYYDDIFNVRMNDPLQPELKTITHLEMNDTETSKVLDHPSEGSFQFAWPINGTWQYYLFFSSGADGQDSLKKDLVTPGLEYKIMVCRAAAPTGPFVDDSGKACLDGGGLWIYGSSGGNYTLANVYAPGGQGVMWDEGLQRVVMYYHYINRTSDMENAQFGWNYLDFTEDGWPTVVTASSAGYAVGIEYAFMLLAGLLASIVITG